LYITISSSLTWAINEFVLKTFEMTYLQTIVFILVIAALVQLVEMILKKFLPPLYNSLGIFLPLITTNCAVLGIAITNIQKNYNF
jgi:electron transport complex protein RnfA